MGNLSYLGGNLQSFFSLKKNVVSNIWLIFVTFYYGGLEPVCRGDRDVLGIITPDH